jgi:16S rRNA (guanine527-N7)-methyltransferase
MGPGSAVPRDQGNPSEADPGTAALVDPGGSQPSDPARSGPGDRSLGSDGVEPEPVVAVRTFGAGIDLARQYAAILVGPGVERGLVGPREAARVWTRHLLNCAVIAECVPLDASVADLGSGAGLPGIPLAIARPDCGVVLIEPLLRRATFLGETISDLGLSNCRVVRSRAEDLVPARRSRAGHARPTTSDGAPPWRPVDVVTSRAVATLDTLARWSVPLLRPGGVMLAMKGSSADDEIRTARRILTSLGLRDVQVVTAGDGVVDQLTVIVRARLSISA